MRPSGSGGVWASNAGYLFVLQYTIRPTAASRLPFLLQGIDPNVINPRRARRNDVNLEATYRTFYQGAQGENRRFGREIGEFRRGMGTVGELPGRNGQFPCDRGGNSPTVPIAEATYGILTPRWAQPAARPETLRAYEDPD
jgi:hypothetical protein